MDFQVKMPENGRQNISGDKQTTKKISLMFLNVTVLTDMEQFSFKTLFPNNDGTVYVFGV